MLRFYTAGESHGQALLAFISGLPASLPVSVDFINHELHRRQLGYGRGGRQKIEKDRAEIFAGVRRGVTIGAPIALRIENRDWANWEKILPVDPFQSIDVNGVGQLIEDALDLCRRHLAAVVVIEITVHAAFVAAVCDIEMDADGHTHVEGLLAHLIEQAHRASGACGV